MELADVSEILIDTNETSASYNAFYDTDKRFIKSFVLTKEVAVPTNAKYFRVSRATIHELYVSNKIITISDILNILANTSEKEYPDYVEAEKNKVIASVRNKISLSDCDTVFGYSTDQHPMNSNMNPVIYGLKALADISIELPMNCICLGGDGVGEPTDVDGIIRHVMAVNSACAKSGCPVVSIAGNHDAFQNNSAITNKQIFVINSLKNVAQKKVVADENKTNTNCYIDDASSNIRFIFVDSEPHRAGYTLDDMRSFVSSVLSGIPNGYKTIIFSHHPLNSNLKDSMGFYGSYSLQDLIIPHADKIICCINGHSHLDASVVDNGILWIETTCAGGTDAGCLDDYGRPEGTANETVFDIFCVNQSLRKIYAVRYGAGYDREWTYYSYPLN